jgi:uncharacterized protein YndB with AHSA1/START domain
MTLPDTLPHHLERTVVIYARRETVFRFFTDTARWASWWGVGSTIDARPGGQFVIRYPNAVEAIGEVIEVVAPERIAFTYGYVTGSPIPPGGSRVTIALDAEGARTRLHLRHEFADADAAVRDEHVQGWRYQLSLFANVVANEVYANVGDAVDGWLTAWSEPDAASREATLARIADSGVRFCDRFSVIEGLMDLSAHFAAAQRFMPGIRLQRHGEVRHCQGVVLADWVALTGEGQERARGTNVFVFNSSARIESVTGFWNQHPQQ